MILDDRIQFFYNHQSLCEGSKILDEIYRKRIDHPQFQNRNVIPKDFFYILIRSGICDNGKRMLSCLRLRSFDPVDIRLLGVGPKRL